MTNDEEREREHCYAIVYAECNGSATCEEAAELLIRERAAARAEFKAWMLEKIRGCPGCYECGGEDLEYLRKEIEGLT